MTTRTDTPSSRRPHPTARRLRRALGVAVCLLAAEAARPHGADAAPRETDPIWRAQLRVRTCNTATAGTNDAVFASLNAANRTALDYGRDDFPVNDDFTYDLVLNGVSRFSDVTRLRVSKNGTNGVCLRRLELRINGVRIFVRDFGAQGVFLDNGTSLDVTIDGGTLRRNVFWRRYRMPAIRPGAVITLPRQEMESRVEATVGTVLSGSLAGWGALVPPRFVQATPLAGGATGLHYDLDLVLHTMAAINTVPSLSVVDDALDTVNGVIDDVNGALGLVGLGPIGHVRFDDVPVDVDFDLDIGCGGGAIAFTVANPVVDVEPVPAIAVPHVPNVPGVGALVGLLNDGIDLLNGQLGTIRQQAENRIEALLGIDALEAGFAAGLGRMSIALPAPICPAITVTGAGNVLLTVPGL